MVELCFSSKQLHMKLTSLQSELLKVYSFSPSEEDLLAVKKLLAIYFANKLVKNVDAAVEEKGITGKK